MEELSKKLMGDTRDEYVTQSSLIIFSQGKTSSTGSYKGPNDWSLDSSNDAKRGWDSDASQEEIPIKRLKIFISSPTWLFALGSRTLLKLFKFSNVL